MMTSWKIPLWWRLKVYFTWGRSAHKNSVGGYAWFVRTPLFCVGHYVKAWRQDSTGLFTGWELNYLPTRWNLQYAKGGDLYKKTWTNIKQVYALRNYTDHPDDGLVRVPPCVVNEVND